MSKYTVVPYLIFSVKLYAVENLEGQIEKYCDTKERAQEVCDSINSRRSKG